MKITICRASLARYAPRLSAVVVIFFTLLGGYFFSSAHAEEFTSTNFVDQNPVILTNGGRSTSASFEVISGSGQEAVGESNSATFGYHSGFFYFPLVSSPTVLATPGDSKVELNWSASVGTLGFTVSGYQIGQATNSNGPFSYSSVGNVLAATETGLFNNTTYFFAVRALDAFGTPIASSSIVSATPTNNTNTTPPSSNGNSGGGAPSSVPNTGSIVVSGTAPVGSTVTILQDGIVVKTVVADTQGSFTTTFANLPLGATIISLYATDTHGIRSAPITSLITVVAGATSLFGNILIPPTITSDKEALVPGVPLVVSGFALPNSTVTIILTGEKNSFFKTTADASGRFSITIPTKDLPKGPYTIVVESTKNNQTSGQSRTLTFTVGDETTQRGNQNNSQPLAADFNKDGKVDLVDFSILLYWFNQPTPPAAVDLNKDGVVNIVDFSIIMYYWSG